MTSVRALRYQDDRRSIRRMSIDSHMGFSVRVLGPVSEASVASVIDLTPESIGLVLPKKCFDGNKLRSSIQSIQIIYGKKVVAEVPQPTVARSDPSTRSVGLLLNKPKNRSAIRGAFRVEASVHAETADRGPSPDCPASTPCLLPPPPDADQSPPNRRRSQSPRPSFRNPTAIKVEILARRRFRVLAQKHQLPCSLGRRLLTMLVVRRVNPVTDAEPPDAAQPAQ